MSNFSKQTDQLIDIFEGLSLGFRLVLDTLSELTGDTFSQVICIGGGTKNRFWTELKADVTQRII